MYIFGLHPDATRVKTRAVSCSTDISIPLPRGIPMRTCSVAAFALSFAVAAASSAAPPNKNPQPYVLESPTLRLEVSPTYSYTVIEKSTGNVLVSENLTTFTIGSSSLSASAISNVTIQPGSSLSGTLALSKNTTAQVNFAFTSADVLQVTLSSSNSTPLAIAERFADAGQRYYGVWENALPNSLDNRGVSAGYDGKEPLGTSTKDVFGPSAGPPFSLTNKNYGIHANPHGLRPY